MFSYSGRVKSPECRWQRRRADPRHFEIFRHGPIIIYTRLPAGGTYYPICMFPASSECLIGISDPFSAFCLRVSVIFPTCSLYPPTKACLLCATPAGMDLYIQVHARRLLPRKEPSGMDLYIYIDPLDFRRSSILSQWRRPYTLCAHADLYFLYRLKSRTVWTTQCLRCGPVLCNNLSNFENESSDLPLFQ